MQIIKIKDTDKAQCIDKSSVLLEGLSYDFIAQTLAEVYKNRKLLD